MPKNIYAENLINNIMETMTEGAHAQNQKSSSGSGSLLCAEAEKSKVNISREKSKVNISREKSKVKNGSEVQRSSPRSPAVFQLLDNEDGIRVKSSGIHTQLPNGNQAGASLQPYNAMSKESVTESKAVTPFRSLDKSRQAIVKAPVRHKSMLSAFFVKQKTAKPRTGKVA